MKMNQLVDALKKWIRGRKEEYILIAQHLCEIVIKIARLLFIIEDEEVGLSFDASVCESRKHHSGCRAMKPVAESDPRTVFSNYFSQCCHLWMGGVERKKFVESQSEWELRYFLREIRVGKEQFPLRKKSFSLSIHRLKPSWRRTGCLRQHRGASRWGAVLC